MTLTDTQLVLLSSASQREDALVTVPPNLKGGAAKKVIDKLLNLKLVKEVAAKCDQPSWRNDENERPVGLKITRVGLAALGVEPSKGEDEVPQPSPKKRSRDAAAAAKAEASLPSPSEGAPRPGTKQAQIISLLSRSKGATLDDLIAATGWLPHTTRAALTGLRKKGYALAKTKRNDGKTVYRIGAEIGPDLDATRRSA
jgi:Protein of unknown function (DUF3489)